MSVSNYNKETVALTYEGIVSRELETQKDKEEVKVAKSKEFESSYEYRFTQFLFLKERVKSLNDKMAKLHDQLMKNEESMENRLKTQENLYRLNSESEEINKFFMNNYTTEEITQMSESKEYKAMEAANNKN